MALDRLEHTAYDVVLMDMQMPVMDGETATRQLRRNPRYRDLPVIAMTANAMESDRQRCFAAGMNDHVAKPIEPAALWAALARWIRPREGLGQVPAVAAGAAAPASQAPVVSPPAARLKGWPPVVPGLNTTLGLQRALGKPVLYADMLTRFAQTQSGTLSQMDAAIAAGDIALAERLAHTLRSVAANIGALDVSEQAQALELALRSYSGAGSVLGSSDRFMPLLGTLAASMEPLLAGLQAWVRLPDAPDSTQDSRTTDADSSAPELAPEEALARLQDLLLRDDPAATEFLQHNATIIQAVTGDAFTALQSRVRNFDFELALELIAPLQGDGGEVL
jgi:two-component system sensor histidine kinase/response regulator